MASGSKRCIARISHPWTPQPPCAADLTRGVAALGLFRTAFCTLSGDIQLSECNQLGGFEEAVGLFYLSKQSFQLAVWRVLLMVWSFNDDKWISVPSLPILEHCIVVQHEQPSVTIKIFWGIEFCFPATASGPIAKLE